MQSPGYHPVIPPPSKLHPSGVFVPCVVIGPPACGAKTPVDKEVDTALDYFPDDEGAAKLAAAVPAYNPATAIADLIAGRIPWPPVNGFVGVFHGKPRRAVYVASDMRWVAVTVAELDPPPYLYVLTQGWPPRVEPPGGSFDQWTETRLLTCSLWEEIQKEEQRVAGSPRKRHEAIGRLRGVRELWDRGGVAKVWEWADGEN